MTLQYYPLALKSSHQSIQLTDSAELLRIDHPRVGALLDIEQVDVSDNGFITSIKYGEDTPWKWIAQHIPFPTRLISLFRFNFLLASASSDEATTVGFALKLLQPTASCPYVGFSPNLSSPPSIYFQQINPYWGNDILELEDEDILQLRTYLSAFHAKRHEDKLVTLMEKFRYAQSANLPTISIRFFEHAVILEMLFLPKQQQELSYRFQLRIAKWFSKHTGADVLTVAQDAKLIYDHRSKIAHSGHARVAAKDLDSVCNYTRRALQQYVLDQTLFEDAYLNELCLRS